MVGVRPRLTGMVICLNEAQRIAACVDSLAFCDEVVVVDSGSTDGTLDILATRPVRVFHRAFSGYNEQKEYGREVSRGEWVLNLDADEVATPELRDEILDLLGRGPPPDVDGFTIPFRNHFRSVWVRRCGYYPDRHLRFVRRDQTRWDQSAPVHEHATVRGRVERLHGHIDHFSFESVDDFLGKSARYAATFASVAHAAGRSASLSTIVLHTVARFLRAYVLRLGFLEGTLGLTISGLQAYEVFQKYVRLWELGRFVGEFAVDPGEGGRDG